MRISHEVPLCFLKHSLKFNDYDYALIHLFEQYPAYYNFFEDSIKSGREVILDNSVFELGSHFDEHLYLKWIKQLKPTYSIIPDKFGDAFYTIDMVKKWSPIIKDLSLQSIGVLQGNTLSDFENCYKKISPLVDKVAISFAQPLFEKLFPCENKDKSRAYGRLLLVNHLLDKGILDVNKKHHLLGISLPQELLFYKSSVYDFIDTVDTSSPIVHGIKGILYDELIGLEHKNKTKLIELFDMSLEEVLKNKVIINKNISILKSFICV